MRNWKRTRLAASWRWRRKSLLSIATFIRNRLTSELAVKKQFGDSSLHLSTKWIERDSNWALLFLNLPRTHTRVCVRYRACPLSWVCLYRMHMDACAHVCMSVCIYTHLLLGESGPHIRSNIIFLFACKHIFMTSSIETHIPHVCKHGYVKAHVQTTLYMMMHIRMHICVEIHACG